MYLSSFQPSNPESMFLHSHQQTVASFKKAAVLLGLFAILFHISCALTAELQFTFHLLSPFTGIVRRRLSSCEKHQVHFPGHQVRFPPRELSNCHSTYLLQRNADILGSIVVTFSAAFSSRDRSLIQVCLSYNRIVLITVTPISDCGTCLSATETRELIIPRNAIIQPNIYIIFFFGSLN
jgi:hypothetical protein